MVTRAVAVFEGKALKGVSVARRCDREDRLLATADGETGGTETRTNLMTGCGMQQACRPASDPRERDLDEAVRDRSQGARQERELLSMGGSLERGGVPRRASWSAGGGESTHSS